MASSGASGLASGGDGQWPSVWARHDSCGERGLCVGQPAVSERVSATAGRFIALDDLTRVYFAQFVGKRVGPFLDHVRSEYRLSVAHANLTEYFKLFLDPADVRIDHRIDFTNAALEPVVAEMIADEMLFIAEHRLGT